MEARYALLHHSRLRQFLEANCIFAWLLFLLLCALNISLGYAWKALTLSFNPSVGANIIGLPVVNKNFTYRKDLADHPTNRTDLVWQQFFPAQGGYFRHPEISPQRATFSAFHQLHCLNGIRHSYWKLYDIAVQGRSSDIDELPLMQSPSHVRHCLDLIRQSLMCRPDLTVELKDEAAGGSLGFGTVHSCLAWHELVEWVSNWEDYE